MSLRIAPPFRADHVGSFLRPKYLLDAREQRANGEITAEQLRAVEDKAITEIVKFQEDVGLQSHHRRRVPPHLFPHRLPRAARRRQDRHPGDDPQARRHRGARAAGDARDRQGAPRQGHPARRLRVPEVAGQRRAARPRSRSRRRRCCTSAAAAPASAASTTPSSSRRSTRTWPTPTATSCARSPRPAAPTCRWTTPTSPTCATTRCAKRRASAATTRTSCRTATPGSSTRWSRKSPPA